MVHEKSEKELFRCSFDSHCYHKNWYNDFSALRLGRIMNEFLGGLPEEDRSKHFWRDFT